jgi:hypothetical protein
MRGVPIAGCYTSVVVAHYQELVPLLVIPDDAAEEGVAPIMSSNIASFLVLYASK